MLCKETGTQVQKVERVVLAKLQRAGGVGGMAMPQGEEPGKPGPGAGGPAPNVHRMLGARPQSGSGEGETNGEQTASLSNYYAPAPG